MSKVKKVVQKPEVKTEEKKQEGIRLETGNVSALTIQLLNAINLNIVTLIALLKNRWIEEDKK